MKFTADFSKPLTQIDQSLTQIDHFFNFFGLFQKLRNKGRDGILEIIDFEYQN